MDDTSQYESFNLVLQTLSDQIEGINEILVEIKKELVNLNQNMEDLLDE